MKIFKKKRVEFQTHSPVIYNLYNYLKENAVGYENRLKANQIMHDVGIRRDDQLRQYILEIRQSTVLQKIVCSEAGHNGGYWIATDEQEVYLTLEMLFKRAMEMLKTYSSIKRKLKLDRQMRMVFKKYEKEVWESLLRKKNN